MASSSNSLIATNAIGHPVTERLTKTNYPLWKLQVLPALRGAQLIGYVDGTVQAPAVEIDDDKEKKKVPNPAYVQWLTQDQQVFSYLVSSLSREVLTQVATCTYAAQIVEGVGGHVCLLDACTDCQHSDRADDDSKRQHDDCRICRQDEDARR